MAVSLDTEKLKDGLKNIKDKRQDINYEKKKHLMTILCMIETEEIDYDAFSLQDVEELLEIYYQQESPDIENGLSDYLYLRERMKQVRDNSRGGAKKYAFI